MLEGGGVTGGGRRLAHDARTFAQARIVLSARLAERRSELEDAILVRTYAIADPTDADPAYREGLRASVSIALDYALEAVERGGGESTLPIPVALLGQARIAARNGLSLDTVLRRYFAGYSLFGYFLLEEASRDGLMGAAGLQRLLGTHASVFDRLLEAVGAEHARESALRLTSSERRQTKLIERLLEGELVDTSALHYDFGAHHLGLIGAGLHASQLVHQLKEEIDCRLLLIRRDEETAWAWLGSRRRLDSADVADVLASIDAAHSQFAVGEPGSGPAGWRLTHRQATAALAVASRSCQKHVRYADVALLASVLQDDLLAKSLRQIYLVPLERERDGGTVLCKTLRAFFAVDGSLSSAAKVMDVSPRTIGNRLRRAEEAIGRPLHMVKADLQTALQFEELNCRSVLNPDK